MHINFKQVNLSPRFTPIIFPLVCAYTHEYVRVKYRKYKITFFTITYLLVYIFLFYRRVTIYPARSPRHLRPINSTGRLALSAGSTFYSIIFNFFHRIVHVPSSRTNERRRRSHSRQPSCHRSLLRQHLNLAVTTLRQRTTEFVFLFPSHFIYFF